MKFKVLVMVISTSVLTAGCVSTGNFCDVSTVYRPQQGEVYSQDNKRWIVSHNEFGAKHCGWKP